MENSMELFYSAFEGQKLLAQGALSEVALKVRRRMQNDPSAMIFIFSDATGKQMDFDLRGSEQEILERLQIFISPEERAPSVSAGPGRPKLGVVAREVSMLPRHWEWLAAQPGGASATLRKLVEDAKKVSRAKDLLRQAQERTHKFMSAMAGDFPHYEEALRALYAKDKKKFREQVKEWPTDVKDHCKKLAEPVFD